MKSTILLAVFCLLWLNTVAQAPQAFRYQAVARNSSGEILANQKVSFRITIQQRIVNGIVVYAEQHSVTTNGFGLANLEVGKGTPLNGIFSQVKWGTDEFYLRVEMDPSGGTAYQDMGITQLVSVPYALHAKNVELEADGDATNEIQTMSLNGSQLTLSKGGGTVVLPTSGSGGDNWGTQTVVTDGTLSGNGLATNPLKIPDNGITSAKILDGTIVTADLADQTVSTAKLGNLAVSADKMQNGAVTTDKMANGAVTGTKIAQAGATSGQALKWNGTSWAPARDETGGSGFTLPFSGSASSSAAVFEIKNDATSDTGSGISGETASTQGYGVYGKASATSGYNWGVYGLSSSVYGTGVEGRSSSATGVSWGVKGKSFSPEGIGVYGSGAYRGVAGESSGSEGRGVNGRATSTSGTNYGVYGEAASRDGYGVYGSSTATSGTGVRGSGGTGVEGYGAGIGVFGKAQGTSSVTWGVWGIAVAPLGVGVQGYGDHSDGENCGVKGWSRSTKGIGVMGDAVATTGVNYGVQGYSSSASGYGVHGSSPKYGVFGKSSGSTGRGVIGEALGTSSIGVYGKALETNSTGVYGEGAKYDFYAAGPGTDYGTSSSIRWKNNILVIPDPILKIKAIRGVFFDWDQAHGGKHDVGMIAEEVGKVLPEIVDYEENGTDAIGLDYSKITPLLLEAIKAQQTEIEGLKERVEKLEKLVGASAHK